MVGRCLEAAYRLSLLPSLPSLKKLSARFAENEGTTSCRARHSASVLPTGRQLPLLSREDLRQQPLPLKRKTKSSRQGWITGAPTAKSSATTLRKIARTLTTCSKTYCGDDFFSWFLFNLSDTGPLALSSLACLYVRILLCYSLHRHSCPSTWKLSLYFHVHVKRYLLFVCFDVFRIWTWCCSLLRSHGAFAAPATEAPVASCTICSEVSMST